MTPHTQLVDLLASVLDVRHQGTLPERLCRRATDLLGMDGLVVTVLSTPDHRHVVGTPACSPSRCWGPARSRSAC